jgi:DNA-binding beta-propeller fold protein YncE
MQHTTRILASIFLGTRFLSAQGSFVNWESPHVHPLELTPDGRHLLAVNTPDARLEVFELRGSELVLRAEIPVGLEPVSVRARTSDEVWVVNHVSDSVSVVSLARRNVIATLATDDEPCDAVFAGTPERAFVSCSQANTLLVLDPEHPEAEPLRISLQGEDPRALAVSPAGERVYVALFESGNQTTILRGEESARAFPPNAVSDPDGPYGGVNPPPNSGASFSPPLRPDLPPPPAVGLIVRRDAAGAWRDDNGRDWSRLVSGDLAARSGRPVGWRLLDHDLAVVDAATLEVSYVSGLMNLDMALAVSPADGSIAVVGTEATNEVRFEPNLTGRFVRSHLALLAPGAGATRVIADLNPELDYARGTLPPAEREQTLAEPRGIAWTGDGTRAYVTGMGSNNVVAVDADGRRVPGAPIEVGEGPTGCVLDAERARLYVLDRFSSSISVVELASEREVKRVPFFDPSPPAIRRGRRHLYDSHATSGTGLVSCASCHVDGRTDRLAWDLGNPQGSMKPIGAAQNLGGGVAGQDTGFEAWHPMKGPMLTQTLQDIVGHEPLHWRGDKDGLEEFAPAFVGLLGDDAPPSPAELQELEDFLATLAFPPNPFRTFGDGLSNDVPLPGHYRTGRFGFAGQPLPDGNAIDGRNYSRPPNLIDGGTRACVSCHTEPTGLGTDHVLERGVFRPAPPGPLGENHCALVAIDGVSNVTLKIPQLRGLHERTGFDLTQLENTAGFGFGHDGSVDSLARFVSDPAFHVQSEQRVANLVAYLLAFGGADQPTGSDTDVLQPIGPSGRGSHAAVGRQLTLDSPPDAVEGARLAAMLAEADTGRVGLVVRGLKDRRPRGWYYLGGGQFQSDRPGEIHSLLELTSAAASQAERTFTVVPAGSEKRLGADRDQDGRLDGAPRLARR